MLDKMCLCATINIVDQFVKSSSTYLYFSGSQKKKEEKYTQIQDIQ